MSNESVWARRVEEWQSPPGAAALGVPAGSGRPGMVSGATKAKGKGGFELARVVRTAAPAPGRADAHETPIVVEIGVVRIAVTRGFDGDTLEAVLRLVRA